MFYRNASLVARLSAALWVVSQIAAGATLCVNKKASSGCYPTINAAVAKAAAGDVVQVAIGTYPEDVVIGTAISLIGANPHNTIIDATGLANGISITGVSGVLVSGFTI